MFLQTLIDGLTIEDSNELKGVILRAVVVFLSGSVVVIAAGWFLVHCCHVAI